MLLGALKCHSFTCDVEDTVDRAFLTARLLLPSNRFPYEDSSYEEEHSPLLTVMRISVCSVCVFLACELANIRIFTSSL